MRRLAVLIWVLLGSATLAAAGAPRASTSTPAAQRVAVGRRSIALPVAARVRQLPAEAFTMEDHAVVLHELQIDSSGVPLEAPQLRALRANAEKEIGPLPTSKVVLYPMSGWDAGSPIHLFPHAATIIGIDDHPFLAPNEERTKIPYSKVGTFNFAYYRDVDRLGHVGPALLGAIAQAVPKFRLRGVTLIEHEHFTPLRRNAWTSKDEAATPPAPAVHAIVEFDEGPRTPIRRYVHINGSLEADAGAEQSWWWKAIDKLGPDAVLLKASEHVFDSKRGMARALRPTVLGWLQRSRGVLVEDQDRYGRYAAAAFSELVNRPIPTATDHRKYQNWVPDYAGARTTRLSLDKCHFGYSSAGESIVLTAFDR